MDDPLRSCPLIVLADSNSNISDNKHNRRERSSTSRIYKRYKTSTLAQTLLLIVFLLVDQHAFGLNHHNHHQSSRQQHKTRLSSNSSNSGRTAEHNGTSLAFGELVAVGAISLIDKPSNEAASSNVISANNQTLLLTETHLPIRVGRQQKSSSLLDSIPSGRLIDQIASPVIPASNLDLNADQQRLPPNKLDYIIDFMRNNKLSKFCDLLTRKEPEIVQLNKQLNLLDQFTLFVPTNEALNLMPPRELELATRRPDELRKFLLSHLTSELVIPKLNLANVRESLMSYQWNSFQAAAGERFKTQEQRQHLQASASSTNLVFALTGSPLRVTTGAFQNNAHARQNLTSQALDTGTIGRNTRLELIVNGAQVLNGHSYALQEPNNISLTYAIVHLIDKPLWPAPSETLLEKIRQLAPNMYRLIELSKDLQLFEALDWTPTVRQPTQNQRLATVFLPSDDSLKLIPSKLMIKLETNSTFLAEFLKGHILEGLYYSGQLRPATSRFDHEDPRPSVIRLSALSNMELEFESKVLQSRSLLLVNSVPILEPDVMSLNGVIHLIGRPLFERTILEACECGDSNSNNNNEFNKQQVKPNVAYELESSLNNGPVNWLTSAGIASEAARKRQQAERILTGNELEREETSLNPATIPNNHLSTQNNNPPPSAGIRLRSQRSGNLPVGANNRDFYRPSAAPANLLTLPNSLSARTEAVNQSIALVFDKTATASMINDQQAGSLFEDNKYKIVLNATSRQRMRQQQLLSQINAHNSSNADDPQPSSSGVQFSYDRPLNGNTKFIPTTSTTQQPSPGSRKRPYSPVNSTAGESLASAAADANNWFSPPYNTLPVDQKGQLEKLTADTNNRQQRLLKFKLEDARDNVNQWEAANPLVSNRLNSSTKISLNAKQLDSPLQVGKTTVTPSNFGGCAFYDTQCKRLVGKLVRLPPNRSRGAANKQLSNSLLASASRSNSLIEYSVKTTPGPILDSTFGETTTQRTNQINRQTNFTTEPVKTLSQQNRLTGPRVSSLNQPLPPWSEEERRLRGSSSPGQTWRAHDDISRIPPSGIGFAPGISRDPATKMPPPGPLLLERPHVLLMPVENPAQFLANLSRQLSSGVVASSNPSIYADIQPNNSSRSSKLLFSSRQYHTPTPQSVSLATTHLPPMFNQQQQTVSKQIVNDNLPIGRLTNFTLFETYPADEQSGSKGFVRDRDQPIFVKGPPRAPVDFANSPLVQQFNANQNQNQNNSPIVDLNAIKEARKIIRFQSGLSIPPTPEPATDISITSAKLTNNLATQASDQTANMNFVRTVPSSALSGSELASQQSADFFQNRTIAEIIDDSGLRIDGQQVTFRKLRECLSDAELMSLVTQTENSLTIFMPTDLAFQRLVQQQAIAHQQHRQQSSSISARLTGSEPSWKHLIPLVSINKQTALPVESQTLPSTVDDNSLLGGAISSSNAADRLTLDCSSPQVRQLLLDHLSASLMMPKQLLSDTAIGSLSGKQLLLSSFPSKKIVMVDGQPVVAATRAKNGMVYVINKFLNLTQQVPNVMSLIESQPNLKTFGSYLQFSSLGDRLRREPGPITILAPTNEAFEQLSSSARQLINSDPAALMDILRGHILEGAQYGKLISMRNSLKTMNTDQVIEAKVIKPNVYLLDNQMTSIKLIGTTGNGVVNSIDRLIVPAWLRVSMSSTRAAPPPILGAPTSIDTGASNFILDREVDNSVNRNSAALNLPNIGVKPVRFEAPGNRLSANSANVNSFIFNNPINSSPDGFDPLSNLNNNNSLSTPRSPFLKVPSNFSGVPTINSSPPFSNSQPTLLAGDRRPITTGSTVTRNMQLIEKLANLMQTSKFVRYLLRSRVSELLKPDMNYVILIPTDQAIEKLPKQIIEMLDRDQDRLNDLINYHVLDTTFEYINTIPDGSTLNTLNEKDILFNWHRNNTILTASGAVVQGGIQEDNIALLIVDRVLYPTPGDLLNIVAKSPILSNFTAILRNANLERQLSLPGPFTLFAPSDFAFNQLPKRDFEFLQRDRDTARRFLLRHMSQPAIFTSSIALSNQTATTTTTNSTNNRLTFGGSGSNSFQTVPTMLISNSLGEDLTLRQRNDYFSVNDVNFSYADVAATNGVVHVIDGLL